MEVLRRLIPAPRILVLAVLVGVLAGGASALFLSLLERATAVRVEHEALLFALPFVGLLVGTLYERHGKSVRAGTNLIVDGLAGDGPRVPLRMAPLVLAGTLLTHLFGGSAGREGTAVQMGGSLADEIACRLRIDASARCHLLAAGVAGGFGSVFGTPLAGAVFTLEFIVIGRLELRYACSALVAAFVGDRTTRALGITHAAYPTLPGLDFSILTLVKLTLVALGIAAASVVFIELTSLVKRELSRLVPKLGHRMFLGGLALVVLARLFGAHEHLGLGLPLLERALDGASTPPRTFAVKLLLTGVTLGSGFLGGEVTPLFVVGATLGSALGAALGLPPATIAAVGMVSLFGASANTPLAVAVMTGELFGAPLVPWVLPVAFLARRLKGRRSIYSAQRHTEAAPAPSNR
ncbi:MAG: chloride channel protein [Deltaproteobacteria bacterium]|nr:chloride channel protein [Deltaproteobacteria bacterium]